MATVTEQHWRRPSSIAGPAPDSPLWARIAAWGAQAQCHVTVTVQIELQYCHCNHVTDSCATGQYYYYTKIIATHSSDRILAGWSIHFFLKLFFNPLKNNLGSSVSLQSQIQTFWLNGWKFLLKCQSQFRFLYLRSENTHVTQDRTRHPGFPALQLRLTCDQICTGSEWLHVKYGAKEIKRVEIIGNHVNIRDHWQATSNGRST